MVAWLLSGLGVLTPAVCQQVMVRPDPNAPLVALEIWVRTGSANETRETSGAAHLLEHLIFKGTARHAPGVLDDTIESAGGILEATTERDWTRYRAAVLPDRWEPCLRMLLHHLLQPALPEAELERERAIILQDEYALHRADPIRTARYALYEKAYGEHPYALPPLGIPDTLAKLTREQVLAFHARHYRPERMVIVVVGRVEPARVQAVVQEEISKPLSPTGGEGTGEGAVYPVSVINPSPQPSPQRGEGANQSLSPRRGEGERASEPLSPTGGEGTGEGADFPAELIEPLTPTLSPEGRGGSDSLSPACGEEGTGEGVEVQQSGWLALGVKAPPANPPDAMLAAEVVRLALAEPYLGLLYQPLNHRQDARATDTRNWQGVPFVYLQSEYMPRPIQSLMLFFFQLPPDSGDEGVQKLRAHWHACVRQIVEGRARWQLERAKGWLIARHQQAMANPLERARLYALYATLGLPTLPDEYLPRLQSLSVEQIEQVARGMLNPSLTLGEREFKKPLAPAGGEGERVSEPLSPACGGEGTGEGARGEETVYRQVLANGMRVIALRQSGARQVVMQLLVATGLDAERDFPAGTGELTARMLFTATHNETQATMAMRIARSGGALTLSWEPVGVRILAVAEPAALENVLSLLREGLTRAVFEPESLRHALQLAIAERQRTDGTHEFYLYDQLLRQLNGASGLYATAEQLQRVRLEHIRAFYRLYYRPERFVFVIAGDLPVERLTELVQRYFGTLEGTPSPPAPSPTLWERGFRKPLSPAGGEGERVSEPLSPARGGEGTGERAFYPAPLHAGARVAVAACGGGATLYLGFGLRVQVRTPADYAVLMVLHALLCEGKGSALFQQMRQARGVGYAFGGAPLMWHGDGLLLGFLQVGASRASQQQELLNALQTLATLKEIDPNAFRRAVALAEGRWRLARLDIVERTRRLALAEVSGVGYHAEEQLPDWLQKLDRASVLTDASQGAP